MKKKKFISTVTVTSAWCCANSYATSSTHQHKQDRNTGMIQLLILEILALIRLKYGLPVLFCMN